MSRELGEFYEQIAEHVCKGLGYQVLKPSAGNQSCWDRIVNGNRLQIKKRCVDESKPNNIRLVTSLSSSAAVYRTEDVDAFAIFWRDEWFVFPSIAISEPDGVIRNGLHMPLVMHFKSRWDVLAGESVRSDMQKVLF